MTHKYIKNVMEKRYLVLMVLFALIIYWIMPVNKHEGICMAKITYSIGTDVSKHIDDKISLGVTHYSSNKKYFGVEFDICDVERDIFEVSLHYFEKGPDREHFLNTNKFLVLDNNFEIPVISSDVYFTKNIKPSTPYEWKTMYGSDCIEIITFNGKGQILKIVKCGNGI